jgi:cell shape-determining protein MreC
MTTITTEEAEQLATVHDWTAEDEQTSTGLRAGAKMTATALRAIAAERDGLKAENANLRDDLASAERERAHQQGRADRNAAEYAREQKKREQLQAENARLREALDFYGDISKYPAPLTGGMGALWEDCGQIARAALVDC